MTDTRTVIDACPSYDDAERVITAQFEALGANHAFFAGKKTVIKPNLIFAAPPEKCITTHPALVEAVARYIIRAGGEVVVAESPGGPYTGALLNRLYRVTGIAEAARRVGAKLNTDTSSRPVNAPRGVSSHCFDIITPVLDADIIVNLAKLKTHTLTMLTAAAKNLFGVVPGVLKFEIHSRYKNQDHFQSALVDLAALLCETKPILSVVDAVDAMEGNGPSSGRPRHVGCLISGFNPFAVDLVCAEITGMPGEVKMLNYAAERELCPGSVDRLGIPRERLEAFSPPDFAKPDTRRGKRFELIPRFLAPRPVVGEDCTGCGICYKSCPVKTINMNETAGGKKRARIADKNCIRCFCCQELCPAKAIVIKKHFIIGLLSRNG